MRRGSRALSCFFVLLACGDDADTPTGDAGTTDAASWGGPVLPSPPELPTLTPCAAGWAEATEDDVTTCEPWAVDAPPTCAPDEAPLPSAGGCTAIGDPCPAGDWADGLAGSVIYVREGATDGDGSMGSPFGSITTAMSAAAPGTTVAVSKGTFDEEIAIAAGVTLQGACVDETILVSSSPSIIGVVNGARTGAVLRDVTIGRSPRTGLRLTPGGSLTLERVLIDHTADIALLVSGAELTGSRLVVRDTDNMGGAGARGAVVNDGGAIDLTGFVFERNGETALIVEHTGTTATLVDGVIRDTRARASDGSGGLALRAREGATVGLRLIVAEGNREASLGAYDPGTTLSVEDSLIRRNEGREKDGADGRGVTVQNGAQATLRRVLLEQVRAAGVSASATLVSGTHVRLEHAIVRDVQLDAATDGYGRALSLDAGATMEATHVLFIRTRDLAISASRSTLMLTHATIREVAGQSDGRFGRGVGLQRGSIARLERVSIDDVRDAGIFVLGPGTSASLTDVAVRSVEPRAEGLYGRGIDIYDGSTVTGTRVLVAGAYDVGVNVHGRGRMDTSATLSDVTVLDVAARGCAATTCADAPAGMGVGAYGGGALELTRFSIARASLCGIHVQSNVDLQVGEVRESPIAVCLQVEGYDLARLSDGVTYRDNGSNLDSTILPIPEPNIPSG